MNGLLDHEGFVVMVVMQASSNVFKLRGMWNRILAGEAEV